MLKAVSQLLLTISLLTNVSHGLTITKSEKYAPSIFPSTAYHIEEDVENPEQLIVATFQSLGTLQYGGQLETFVGRGRAGYSEGQGSSALFNMTSSFYQINSTHIIVVDKRNHCLRWVNRLTNSTSLFAGKCTSSGFGDGQATEARFNEPNTIVSPYKNGTYYLTDSKTNAVRVLRVLEDHQSVVIETIIQNDHLLNNVKSLAVYLNNYMLVSAASHLLQVTGNTIMTLEEFDEDIEYLYSLSTENLLLVVDYEGIYQLNLLNLQGDTVWNPSLGGSCSGEKPHSVSLSTRRDQLYVGYQDCVEVLTLKGILYVVRSHNNGLLPIQHAIANVCC
ncbi:hypothetical protein EB796_015631 [Bugula neritina]|uniref:Uncharacterized protein n=1 Tax=Bugula neritina TaxID=10212 RepID=A0A7J7JIB0_BUGNE|nr:hypothetical protein EB796_015631 [Bugula neritina]